MNQLPNGTNGEGKGEPLPLVYSDQTLARMRELEEAHGEYTLERVRLQRPELEAEVVHLRGQNIGIQRISKIAHCDTRTVIRICEANLEPIAAEQRRRAFNLRAAGDQLIELIVENPASVPAQIRALAATQCYSHADLLEGKATSIVQHIDAPRFSSVAEYEEALGHIVTKYAKAREAENASVVEAEVAQLPGPEDTLANEKETG